MLTKTNYTEWALIMKVKLQARNLWEAIELGGVLIQEDRLALDAITNVVPQEMWASVAVKEASHKAWEAIKNLHVRSLAVRNAKAQRLQREFESIAFRDSEAVDNFCLHMSNLVAALASVEEEIPKLVQVAKLLRVVPKRLAQVAVAIDVIVDLTKLTLEDASGRLRATEDRAAEDDAPPPARADDKLNLTAEQWEARVKNQNDAGGSTGEQGKWCVRGRRGTSASKKEKSGPPADNRYRPNQCRRCLKTGHWARECPSRPKYMEAHVAQGEEEDGPTLFFASAGVNATPPPPPAAVHLVEKKVVAQLEGGAGRDVGLWYLDTGATNHMTGAREIFTELDTNINGTVRFGDGSVVPNKGRGTILFEVKTGEHQRLFEVYNIPRLMANIVSLGQLDEKGCKVDIEHGLLHVLDEQRRLVVRVWRSSARLYQLRMVVVRLVCLLAESASWPLIILVIMTSTICGI
jgi:hypothetical protein